MRNHRLAARDGVLHLLCVASMWYAALGTQRVYQDMGIAGVLPLYARIAFSPVNHIALGVAMPAFLLLLRFGRRRPRPDEATYAGILLSCDVVWMAFGFVGMLSPVFRITFRLAE